jgi:enamine deaminase RidA (YjgF/YER057c/UK114 family)
MPAQPARTYTTSNPYERTIRYRRAVRRGPFIFVSGTTAIDPSTQTLQHPGDAYLQAKAAFAESLRAVQALGGNRDGVVRVRMFVARQDGCEGVGRAFREVLGWVDGDEVEGGEGKESTDGAPGVSESGGGFAGCAATMVVLGTGGFVQDDMLVEVELDAVVLS